MSIIGFILFVYFIVVLSTFIQINKADRTGFFRRLKGIKQGDRLRLFGGYDIYPQWLDDKKEYLCTVLKYIPGQNKRKKAIVAKLDDPLTYQNYYTGFFVVLETRYKRQNWRFDGPVHIELCNFEPETISYNERDKGIGIEAAASYDIVTL